ncbi:MAG: biopolymer transporter ExbD [Planctomycetota bacterium]|nr:biopolymer transporter ExbD [Planctomycetota bacterium]
MTASRNRSRLRRRRLQPRWGDSLAPLLDVIFLLVIFLLVSARFDRTQTMTVDLPEAQGETKSASVVKSLVVTLLEDGTVLWREQAVSPDQLTELLSQLPPEERLRPLTIRADGGVALESGIQLLEMLGVLGWNEVEFEVSAPNKAATHLEDSPSDR